MHSRIPLILDIFQFLRKEIEKRTANLAYSLSRSFSDSGHNRPIVQIQERETGFLATVSFKNPATARLVSKTFALRFTETQKGKMGLNESIVRGAVQTLLDRIPPDEIRERYTKKGLASLTHHYLRKISRRKVFEHLKSKLEKTAPPPPTTQPQHQPQHAAPEAEEAHRAIENLSTKTCAGLKKVAQRLPRKSAFSPEETGITYAVIGKSFSGKTYFIVQELNKLTQKELGEYSAILFFTESTSAKPLKKLSPPVKKKMIVMDTFCPNVLRTVKRINDGTGNKFKFMIIFDDIIELRGMLLTKSILTLRNSNISTILSIQYEKLLNPAQRSSVHNIYLFNLRTESWEYMLKGYLLGNFKEKIPALCDDPTAPRGAAGGKKTPAQIAQALRECLDDYIVWYDQRKDRLTIYHKMSGKGKQQQQDRQKKDQEREENDSPPPPRHRLYSGKM